MTHDKVKAVARERMAETGEPYAVARRKVLEEHARLKAQQAAAPTVADETPGE